MILKFIGAMWVVSGTLFLWKPHWLKKRLRKKGMRYVRRLMITTYLFFTGSAFGLATDIANKIGSVIPYLGALIIAVVLLIGLRRWYRRLSEHATETFETVEDTIILRVALAYILAGILLIIGSSYGMFR